MTGFCLSNGYCKFSSIYEDRRRRSMRARNLSVPVLILCDGEAVLCNSMECMDDIESFLSWSRAIKVTSTRPLVQSLILLSATQIFTFTNFDELPDHRLTKVLPIQPGNIGVSQNCAAILSCPVVFPLSLVLRKNDRVSLEINPLQLANLKRQLVGTYILYHQDRFATDITLTLDGALYDFHVEDVNFHQITTACSNVTHIFLLAPSTRITILHNEQPTLPMNLSVTDDGKPSPSDGASLLHDTIAIMEEYNGINIPRTFLLSGPAGVGKTHAVEKTVQSSKANIYSTFVCGSAIIGSTSQGSLSTSLKSVFAKVKKKSLRSISLLFLDECDALLSSESATAMLAFELDEIGLMWPHVIVVAATNRIDTVPQGLLHGGKFEHELIIRSPSLSQRKEILDSLLGKTETSTEQVAELTIGFVPADLHAMVRRARIACMNNGHSMLTNLRHSATVTGASALRDSSLSKPPAATWDSIAGDAGGAKTALIQAIEWPRTKKEAFEQLGLAPPRGILLHGPPGCAKTTLARAAAGSESIAFISLSPADVFSAFVGEAEAIVRKAFIAARSAAPCILFFDEIDAILGSSYIDANRHGMHRSGGGSSAESRVLSTFLNEMDGLTSWDGDKVLVIGATNRPSTLDAALLRPGRFDKVIYVPPPDFVGRSAILEKLIDRLALRQVFVKVDYKHLASKEITGNMTGAEILGAFQDILTHWLRVYLASETPLLKSIHQDDIEAGLKTVKPLLGDSHILHEYKKFQKKRRNQHVS